MLRWTRVMVTVAALMGAGGPLVADDPTPEQIEALVLQLGDADFLRREAAEAALSGVGKAAGAALLRHRADADAEVRSRVLRLLEALEILAPEQQAALDSALEQLVALDVAGREGAARTALALGAAGRKALERALQIPAEALEVRVVGPAWIEAGSAWKGVLRIRNTGNKTVLVPLRNMVSPSYSMGSFIDERPRLVPDRTSFQSAAAMGLIEVYSDGPVLAKAHRLAPGEAHEQALGSVFGEVMGSGRVGTWSWSFGLQLRDSLGLDESELWMGMVGQERQHIGFHVVMLPSATPTAMAAATMSIRPAATPVGEELAAEIEIKHGGDAPLRIDADWPRYTWVALASKDGTSIQLGTAAKFSQELPDATGRTALELAPGAVARHSIRIPRPRAAGEYWLVCAYFNAGAPDEPKGVAGKDVDSQGFARGRMLSERVVVAIDAEPGAGSK